AIIGAFTSTSAGSSVPATPSASSSMRRAIDRASLMRPAASTSRACCALTVCASRAATEPADLRRWRPTLVVGSPSVKTEGPSRIRSLDVLRGVGVLGMLVVHIQLFAFPSLARWNPTAYGDLGGLNWWVWLATSVLADGKFISIFAMLLGVSIVMQSGRDGDRPLSAWRAHVR